MAEDREHKEQAKPSVAKTRTDANQGNDEKDGAPPAQTTPWAFYVVVIASYASPSCSWSCGSILPPGYSPKAAK